MDLKKRNVTRENRFKAVVAPIDCSFINQPEMTIRFYNVIKQAFDDGMNVTVDLSQVLHFSETSAAVLMTFIKDKNVNQGRAIKIIWPKDAKCTSKLRSLGLDKKINTEIDSRTILENFPTQKVSNLKVANQVAKSIVISSSRFIYNDDRKLKELYSILIEMMANTNNHADGQKREKYNWWLFFFPDIDKRTIKFVFVDSGVGVFDSLPVKQYLIRNPLSMFDTLLTQRASELHSILRELISGNIKSSTGNPSRGRGLPLISDCSKTGHFEAFQMISNDAYIDLKMSTATSMNEHFSGTLFHFELKEEDELG